MDTLSRRAPAITVFTLCAALVGAWVEAPAWLANLLAVVVGSMALILMTAKGRRKHFSSGDEPEPDNDTGWLAYELAGKGTPPGYYVLAFFGFLTIILTGFGSPYARPAWAGFALGLVWGVVNVRYPADEDLGQ